MAMLWLDVPDSRRYPDPRYESSGCPYAVPNNAYLLPPGMFRPCAGISPDGRAPCPSHDPIRQGSRPSAADQLWNRVRNTLIRSEMTYRHAHDPVGWLRSRSTDDILSMRNVGVKAAEKIREMRDTWDDERILTFLDITPVGSPPIDPERFWSARPDVFSVVGG